jgi:hypothetical protein
VKPGPSTVTSAGLVLAGTFGVFALVVGSQPGGGPYRAVLASLALGILMDAFLVRTLLVPSAVAARPLELVAFSLRLASGCGQFKPAACRNVRAMTW